MTGQVKGRGECFGILHLFRRARQRRRVPLRSQPTVRPQAGLDANSVYELCTNGKLTWSFGFSDFHRRREGIFTGGLTDTASTGEGVADAAGQHGG